MTYNFNFNLRRSVYMAQARSPKYPAISLPEAIEKIEKIHEAQQHTAEPREVVVQHMGYSGLSGTSATILSTLIKYGLLVEKTKGEWKVGERALSIMFGDTVEEKSKAILNAAIEPPLFADIYKKWGTSIPTDESLQNYLVKRQFSTKAIKNVIKSYKETFNFVIAKVPETILLELGDGNSETDVEIEKTPNKGIGEKPVSSLSKPTRLPSLESGINIGFLGSAIQMSGTVTKREDAQKAIDAITALMALLPEANTEK